MCKHYCRQLFPVILLISVIVIGGWVSAQVDDLDTAVQQALAEHRAHPNIPFFYEEVGRILDENLGGIVYLNLKDAQTGNTIDGIVELLVVVPRDTGWDTLLPGNPFYSAAYNQLPPSVLRSLDTRSYKPAPDPTLVTVAEMSDYHFPWLDGQWGTVTRSYGVHGRGQIDFDLGSLDVTAAKDGTIIYANDSHTLNAYNSGAWWYWNVVIIRHTEHQYSLYGHLAPNSIPSEIKAGCTTDYSQPNCAVPVRAGDVIAQEGSTGYSSAPHLHVEFGQQYGIVPYPDLLDEDDDGDRFDHLYAGHIYAEQNVAFRGYQPSDVAGWPYGTIHQASHQPVPPTNLNIVRNGDFSAGTAEWSPSGQISWGVENGSLRFMRLNTTEAPDWALFYQDLHYGTPANTPFEVTFRLGNASGVKKTVSVSLLNAAGERYGVMTCDFVVPANTPPQAHVMRGKTESTWATIRLRVIVNPPDSAPAALIDDIAVQHRPDLAGADVLCG